MHWVEFLGGMVHSKHPADSTVVSTTDLGDSLLQTFFSCRGIYVTGTRTDFHGSIVPDYRALKRAPIFAVIRWLCTKAYTDILKEAPDYLGWLNFWHSPRETLALRPRVHMSDQWREDRAGRTYGVMRFKTPGTDAQLAWYLAYLASTGQFSHTRMMPARYLEFYPRTVAGALTNVWAYRSTPKVMVTREVELRPVYELTAWSWYRENEAPSTAATNQRLFIRRTFAWAKVNPSVLMVETGPRPAGPARRPAACRC